MHTSSSSSSCSSPSGKNLTTFDEVCALFVELATDLRMPQTLFFTPPRLLVVLLVLFTFLKLSPEFDFPSVWLVQNSTDDRLAPPSWLRHRFSAWHNISTSRSLRPLRSVLATVFN